MATPAIDSQVRLRPGDSSDLEEVMEVMDAAFGSRFGEAWTRSQCAGILPMAGVAWSLRAIRPTATHRFLADADRS